MVLFGGQDREISLVGDTWTWDGTTWTQVATTGPSPRVHFDMVYDNLRLAGTYVRLLAELPISAPSILAARLHASRLAAEDAALARTHGQAAHDSGVTDTPP